MQSKICIMCFKMDPRRTCAVESICNLLKNDTIFVNFIPDRFSNEKSKYSGFRHLSDHNLKMESKKWTYTK